MKPQKELIPRDLKKLEGELNSYIVVFTIEGHQTWRANLYHKKEDFDTYLSNPGQKNHPKILKRKFFCFDKINGTITEEK